MDVAIDVGRLSSQPESHLWGFMCHFSRAATTKVKRSNNVYLVEQSRNEIRLIRFYKNVKFRRIFGDSRSRNIVRIFWHIKFLPSRRRSREWKNKISISISAEKKQSSNFTFSFEFYHETARRAALESWKWNVAASHRIYRNVERDIEQFDENEMRAWSFCEKNLNF